MQTQQVVLTTTVVASEPLTQQRLVNVTGGLCRAGDIALGVAEVDGKAGDSVPVNVLGIIAAEAGGAIDVGTSLTVDDQGRVTAAVPAEGKASQATGAVGIALSAAGSEGQLIRVLWRA